ncbi:MAG: YneF family protein [Bacilli bacterium]|nr:YneF family protein [Bacilli bacterium]
MNIWHDILMITIGLIPGLAIGFFLAKMFMENYLKKNPPINEQMITALMTSMGRKPNSKQVKQIMQQMNRQK